MPAPALAGVLFVLAAALALTLAGERVGNRRLVRVGKPVASLCFVAVGVLQLRSGAGFGVLMLAALVLSLVGDVLLIGTRSFPVGLVAFLAAHGAYAAAFAALRPLGAWPVAPLLAIAAASGLALVWLWPYLAGMRLPVAAYVGVMSVMVWGAVAVTGGGAAPTRLAVGALLFYVSDLAVARHRFVAPGFANRAWGLPAYYLGQMLLASCVR